MSFNGWSNLETWNVCIWFGEYLADLKNDNCYPEDAAALKETILDAMDMPSSGLIADFVNNSLQRVDWQELFDAYAALDGEYDPPEDGDTDDAYALASAGMGTDEDYGYYGD